MAEQLMKQKRILGIDEERFLRIILDYATFRGLEIWIDASKDGKTWSPD